jgi:hypothetical protein
VRRKTIKSEPYWICNACAAQRGWTCDKTGITMIEGQCGWCKTGEIEPLTPVRDFDKRKRGGGE